jgi:hypothetical protein
MDYSVIPPPFLQIPLGNDLHKTENAPSKPHEEPMKIEERNTYWSRIRFVVCHFKEITNKYLERSSPKPSMVPQC